MNAIAPARINPRLWVVDDDEDDRMLIADSLRECAFPGSVRMFEGGVEVMRQIDGESRIPDLLLLDLNLPKVSGIDILRRIRASSKAGKLPVIILTTSGAEDDVSSAYAAGANAYIQKPSSYDGMVERFRTLLKFWVDTAKLPRA